MTGTSLAEAYAAAHRAGRADVPPACLRFVLEVVRAAAARHGRGLTPADTVQALAEASRREFGPLDAVVREEWGLQDGADVARALRLLEACGAVTLAPEDTGAAFAGAAWPSPEPRT